MKIIAILLFVAFVSINGWSFINDLDIEDISGRWEASYPSPIINVFPEDGFPSPTQFICRENVTDECEKTIPNVLDVFTIDADENTLNTTLTAYPLANSTNSSTINYPACAGAGVILKSAQLNSTGKILNYENGRIIYEDGDLTSCFIWDVFVVNNTVKAIINQIAYFALPYDLLTSRFPYSCLNHRDKDDDDDDDSFSRESFKNGDSASSAGNNATNSSNPQNMSQTINKNVECLFEATSTGLIVSYEANFVTTCVEGDCLNLARKRPIMG